ncbi:vacuolar protein sorting-associated protein 41 homolog [Lutzomyia longipalpis]|uniref:vacuolar protein sorting-associated protein 41 homolog n=1 Tax=Lutzomyia longipalpis TaxID=7200 RepID=UPI002483CB9A|nr:vacuolar protein sorting-associated protein 41 homolog [Lutzomyia longipalpis]
MSEVANDDPETETESCAEEDVEPKLKYVRMSNDLQNILNKDTISCIAVHPKFLCVGTHWGEVHLLDHQGNTVSQRVNVPHHMVAVNQISVDGKGEHIGTCSDDGMVIISGLCTDENNQKLNIGRAVRSLCLDPLYYKSGSGRKFIVGDNKLSLYEKTFLKSLKSTVLSESEGNVSSMAWNNQFVAWASALGVRVYDLSERWSLGLIRWEQPKSLALSDFRCNLRWSNSTTLLIGWVDTIRICVIRKRNSVEVSTRDLPGFIVDPVSTFQTDFFVCGLAPLEANQLVVLGVPKERDLENSKSLRPILTVLLYKSCDYVEICTDSLSLRGYQEFHCNDYSLDCLIEENQYFIVSPKDIVVASPYEHDDRIQWLIEHGRFEQAMEVISVHGGRYSLVSVARLYLDHLLTHGLYEDAAKLCLRAFGNDKLLWEEEVYKFVKVQQLRAVSMYLPRSMDCKLNPHVYEMVLYEYLKLEPPGFLALIKEWHPTLYNTSAVINAVQDHYNEKDKAILLESLAILYSHEKKYEKALAMYLKLQHKDVFALIKKHDLYAVIHRMIVPLMQLDTEKAIAMLLEKNKIASDVVVAQLEAREDYLYVYLDALDRVDPSGRFHWKMVGLYAKYAREKLLPFLKRSNKYPIQEAYDICKERLYYPEMVYLLGRMGNTREALSILLHKLENVQLGIEFCKDNDDMDLWHDLINESLDKPHVMTKLLDGIAGYINPDLLVSKIKLGQKIPGLKKSLIKTLTDYSLQVTIQDGCNQILVTDYFNLHEKLYKTQQKAIHISNDFQCGLCRRSVLTKESTLYGNTQSNGKHDILAFNCRHVFHENCLPDKSVDFCTICKSKK